MQTKYIYSRDEMNRIFEMLASENTEDNDLALILMEEMTMEQNSNVKDEVRFNPSPYRLYVWTKVMGINYNPCQEIYING